MAVRNARVLRGTLSTVFTTLVAPITVGLVIHSTQPGEKPAGDPAPTQGQLRVVGQDGGWTQAGPVRDAVVSGVGTTTGRVVDAQPWDRDSQKEFGPLQDWSRGQPFYQETVTVTVVRKAFAEGQAAGH